MHITSAAGTDISAPVANDMAIIECGDATKVGFMAGLPDGEVSSRPLEGQAQGVFVVDGPCTVLGLPTSPIKITVKDGKVVNIEGDSPEADQLREIVSTVENADNVAEFGVGGEPGQPRRRPTSKRSRNAVARSISPSVTIFTNGGHQKIQHPHGFGHRGPDCGTLTTAWSLIRGSLFWANKKKL